VHLGCAKLRNPHSRRLGERVGAPARVGRAGELAEPRKLVRIADDGRRGLSELSDRRARHQGLA